MIVVLMGYMGSGKSTIGKKLATLLNYDFLDLDDFISWAWWRYALLWEQPISIEEWQERHHVLPKTFY